MQVPGFQATKLIVGCHHSSPSFGSREFVFCFFCFFCYFCYRISLVFGKIRLLLIPFQVKKESNKTLIAKNRRSSGSVPCFHVEKEKITVESIRSGSVPCNGAILAASCDGDVPAATEPAHGTFSTARFHPQYTFRVEASYTLSSAFCFPRDKGYSRCSERPSFCDWLPSSKKNIW